MEGYFLWKHFEKSENAKISLHDCIATRAFIEDNNLYFEYDDGFWIIGTNENNLYNNTFGTDISQLKICNFEVVDIYVFSEFRLFHHLINTRRVSIKLETLIRNINSGKWKLEFLYTYQAYRGVLFHCCIQMKHRPYHKECQIVIDCDDMEFFWNNICKDKPW